MGNRLDSKLRGLLIPDDRMGVDGLAVNDGTATGSDYTQLGGRPGSSSTADPNSRIVPVVSGGLEEGLELQIVQAGDPGIEADSARLHWRQIGETDFDWRGWAAPNYATSWAEVLIATDGNAESNFDAVVDPVSQRVLVATARDPGLFDQIYFRRSIDGATFDSFASAPLPIDETTLIRGPALTILPSGRVLLFYQTVGGKLWYSDDIFDAGQGSWLQYATPTITDALAPAGFLADFHRMEADRDGNVLLLAFQEAAGAEQGYVVQHVSRNLGATFTEIDALQVIGASPFPRLRTTVLPSGEIVVAYLFDIGSIRVRVLASPFDLLSEAVETTVDTLVLVSELSIWSDPRGVLYIATGTDETSQLYRSIDKGATWDLYEWGGYGNPGLGNKVGLQKHHTVATRGGAAMIHGSASLGGYAGHSLGCLWLGGWTNIEPSSDSGTGTRTAEIRQPGWRDVDGAGAIFARTWIAMDEPDVSTDNWTRIATGAGTSDRGTITVGSTDELYFESAITGQFEALFTTIAGSGGSTALPRHAVRVVQGVYEFEIRFDDTSGVRVHDVHAAADIFTDATAIGLQQVRIGYDLDDRLYLHYKAPSSNLWIEALAGVALTAGAAAGNTIAFGSFGTTGGASTQTWQNFFVREGGAVPLNPTYSIPATATDRQHRGAALGGLALPLDRVGLVDVDEGAVALRGGPAIVDELHTVPTVHDFGIARAIWDASPSPGERWRSDGVLGDEILTWTFPEATRVGGSWLLGLIVLDANFSRARLEVDTVGGGAGWITVATLDLREGFVDLAYERHGDTIRPGTLDAGTVEGDRFLNRAELAGGVARWGTGPTVSARIEMQSAGGWTAIGTNTIQPFVRVDADKVAGSSTVSDGPGGDTLKLQAPSGLVVAYLDEQYIFGVRVVVPAGATPEGYREAGLIMPAAFSAMGQQWSRGYSVETEPNAIRDQTRHGTIRKRQEGPPASRISMAWPDGVKLHQLRAGIDVDYLGPSGKPPAVADSDVWGQLWGILDETKSGEIPVVYVAELPPDGVTLTDRTLFGFGTLDGSARFEHSLGDEGVDEFGRIAGVQVAEIK